MDGQGYLEAFPSINETFLIALDGTDFFFLRKYFLPLPQAVNTQKWPDSLSPYRGHPDVRRSRPEERDGPGTSICPAPERSRQTRQRTGRLRGKLCRPFQNRAEVSCRGYSTRLQRAITDFGADVPFSQVREKIREHYGIRFHMANRSAATIA